MRNTVTNSLKRIVKRTDYLRVREKGDTAVMPGLVLQASRSCSDAKNTGPRIGYTVSKKVGNAVQRNRVRRRLKAIASDILPKEGSKSLDYVLIGRATTLTRTYDLLAQDFRSALKKIDQSDLPKRKQ